MPGIEDQPPTENEVATIKFDDGIKRSLIFKFNDFVVKGPMKVIKFFLSQYRTLIFLGTLTEYFFFEFFIFN